MQADWICRVPYQLPKSVFQTSAPVEQPVVIGISIAFASPRAAMSAGAAIAILVEGTKADKCVQRE